MPRTKEQAGPSTSGLAHSFRDPGGRVFSFEGRILRVVNREAAEDLCAFLESPAAARAREQGRLISSRRLEPREMESVLAHEEVRALYDEARGEALFEHERIPFPSYPFEWPPEMLYAAGELTLELAQELLAEDFGLKDATPANVLFRGSQPVFVDALSVERRDPRDPVWLPYAQFQRTFLLPLLAHKHLGWRTGEIFLGRRDGLEPEEVYRAAPLLRRWFPPFLSAATLPALLTARNSGREAALYRPKRLDDPERARFVLASVLRRLQRQLRTARPAPKSSQWSDYATSATHYSQTAAGAKREFVCEVLAELRPPAVLDVGCNTGDFSVEAAAQGARVVAMDQDAAVVDQLYRRARERKLDILPLAVDFARPTPATGWRNRETPGFLERARGSFDAVLMLAVLHHLVVNERVPLEEILSLASELTTSALVIEFIAREDPMFRRIVRGRHALFEWYTQERFEQACRRHFTIARSQPLPESKRRLYLLVKKS